MSTYKSRAEQVEKEILRPLLKVLGIVRLSGHRHRQVRRLLRDAAIMGAYGERDRTLEIIAETECFAAIEKICSKPADVVFDGE